MQSETEHALPDEFGQIRQMRLTEEQQRAESYAQAPRAIWADDFNIVVTEVHEAAMPDLYINGVELKSWIRYNVEQGVLGQQGKGCKVTVEFWANLDTARPTLSGE